MPKAPKVKVSEKIVHPKSRKAAQMIRNAHRKDRVDKKKSERTAILQSLADKVQWFKDHIKPEENKCSIQDVHNLINVVMPDDFPHQWGSSETRWVEYGHVRITYFMRFDAELEQLRIGEKIKGRQQQTGAKFTRENNIKMILEREQQVYESSGLEIPDLTSAGNVKMLRAWNGNLDHLPKIKLKRFCSSEITTLEKADNMTEIHLPMMHNEDTDPSNKLRILKTLCNFNSCI